MKKMNEQERAASGKLREELDKLEVELDDAINDLEKSLEDLETWNSCMEMYDYDPPEGMCE